MIKAWQYYKMSIVIALSLARFQVWLEEATEDDQHPLQHASVFLKFGDEGLNKNRYRKSETESVLSRICTVLYMIYNISCINTYQ